MLQKNLCALLKLWKNTMFYQIVEKYIYMLNSYVGLPEGIVRYTILHRCGQVDFRFLMPCRSQKVVPYWHLNMGLSENGVYSQL